ncbi:MAG: SH3 domain-containing protein [Defluviitaleaceae bacterium]|nr:SH3 domain-containing protein [Defluviitaleaceae bacterium]
MGFLASNIRNRNERPPREVETPSPEIVYIYYNVWEPSGPTPAPQRPAIQPTENITGEIYQGETELPINGATGWAAVSTPLRTAPNANAEIIHRLAPGNPFVIISEQGNWWYVGFADDVTGWVDNRTCFINLPDILPSIVWRNTNATSSVFASNVRGLPDIYRQPLYNARSFNPRLNRYEYIMPGLYSLGVALHQAQQLAMAEGETLVVNEVFRPFSTQQQVVRGLTDLANEFEDVRLAINYNSWHMGWFIATGVSGHQRGSSIDLSLGYVKSYEYRVSGDFIYLYITNHTPVIMQSRIHELSSLAVIVDNPRTITVTQILNGSVRMSSRVTDGTKRLQMYMAQAGFHPLASEWWHFDHAQSETIGRNSGIRGDFYTESIYSWIPLANYVLGE